MTFGLFDGNHKDYAADYLFATVQTMSLPHHLAHFSQDHFDYIVIDETHRAAAQTYQTILNHFTPKFLLGMTATPERMSGEDIFQYFDHNIAYEIRLKDALEADLLTTFHYYGIADIVLTDDVKKPPSFNQLIREERVAHILEKITHYSTDTGDYRGLVFCSSVEEADALSAQFCGFGFRACALSGRHSEHEREAAIESLESDDVDHLQFIFTVDIFNEGSTFRA
ncbi:NgoFVII family restriction endonuclease [Wohlfahrtiimonas chitiniclastica]|nr:DEAD/DEAH box helicase family protein [Wohlfahrtiimonas chitiniclastica]KZS22508.1 NgoFVII family restriction endonuclease [Wohlfahrtiimonas chitiniclastica]